MRDTATVLFLLPPSEGKAEPAKGRPLDLARLSFPTLTAERERLLTPALRTAPALPARDLYTGVLYAALDLPSLPAVIQRRFVIISAQYGAVRPGDRIATYRREIDAKRWRPLLEPELVRAAGRGAILDCRSATYAAAWRPSGALAERTAHVSVVREAAGVRTVVSHDAKKTRGEVARYMAETGETPRTVAALVAVVRREFPCELEPPERRDAPWRLTIVTT
ncbi:MAG: YaaA family protein [Gaiellales bacterium]